jgi:hypothetical protein
MLLATKRAGPVEFNRGVQRLVAGRIDDDAPIFGDVEIGTFKCHMSRRADKNEFHWGSMVLCQQCCAKRADKLRVFGNQHPAAQSFGQKGRHAGVLGHTAGEDDISFR